MKRCFFIVMMSLSLPLLAQESVNTRSFTEDAPELLVESDSANLHSLQSPFTGITLPYSGFGYSPVASYAFRPFSFYSPFSTLGFWDIHEGFNASISTGLTVGFGKNNPYKGANFFTNLAGLYAFSLSKRWTMAFGGNYCNYTGWGKGVGEVSLFGLANYQINERLDITGYLSHDFGQFGGFDPQHTPYMPGFTAPGTTVGADLGIKVGNNAKISVGVSVTRENEPDRPGIIRQH